jgi:hypothetical protein
MLKDLYAILRRKNEFFNAIRNHMTGVRWPSPRTKMRTIGDDVGSMAYTNSRSNAKNIHTPKARMFIRINELSQKWGLDRKPECPLGSTKGGLHRMHERCKFLHGMCVE